MTQAHRKESTLERETTEVTSARTGDLLERVDTPQDSADLTLTSGRRYELRADGDRDQVTIRSSEGNIVLRIEVTDAGPVLSFSGASIDLVATRKLRFEAEDLALQAKRNMTVETGGSLHEKIHGDHHTRVDGNEQLEAAAVELQANTKAVAVRAMENITLDGERIGLNDDPLPQPFSWSKLAED